MRDLRDRVTVYRAVAAENDKGATECIERLPTALGAGSKYPALIKALLAGCGHGGELAGLVRSLAEWMKITVRGPIYARHLDAVEKALNAELVAATEGGTAGERVAAYLKRGSPAAPSLPHSSGGGGDSYGNDQRAALSSVMGSKAAIAQLGRLERFEKSGSWTAEQLLELALTGKPGPEMTATLRAELATS